jgi:putative FmdB family regulatory protein
MPTYEYICKKCKFEFEKFQYIKDKPLLKCPNCKKNKLRKKIGSGSALIFKGRGFFCNDYKDKH